MDNGTVKYDPKTGKFTGLGRRPRHVRLGSAGQCLVPRSGNGQLTKINTNIDESKPTSFVIPKNQGIYDTDTDSKGRTDLYIWIEGKIGLFDPKTVEYTEYKTPTPMSGPRRGQIDGQNRLWAAEFYAGQVLMFDPDKKLLKEYPLFTGEQALHGALCGALLGERRRQEPDRVDARFQQRPPLPDRHE